MTGTELAAAVGLDLRDVAATNYRLHERLAYLKRALRSLALDLARRKSHLVRWDVLSGSTNWPAVVVAGQDYIDLPDNFMSSVKVYISGLEDTQGPLSLASVNECFAVTGQVAGYFIEGNKLWLVPTPDEAVTIRLIYNAWPELALAEPVVVSGGDHGAADASAATQLAGELPWFGIFDEGLRAFVTQACANRNEYDTTVELGLMRMLLSLGHEAAGLDTAPEFYPPADDGHYDFSGR